MGAAAVTDLKISCSVVVFTALHPPQRTDSPGPLDEGVLPLARYVLTLVATTLEAASERAQV